MFVNVVPHCHVCMEELKIGERVVLSDLLACIIHEDCNYLPEDEVNDRGKYEEVVFRNQRMYGHFIAQ